MDKIDMSLDDIIKQNRKDNRKRAVLKKKATASLKNRPSGPAGQRQGRKPRQAKAGLQVKGRAGQLKQFRARIGGKTTVGKGVAVQKRKGARLQQQGVVIANRGPARKVGKQRLPVKRTAGTQVVNRNRKQQQVQQQVQQSKTARQQQFNLRRGIQAAPQGGGQKNIQLNRQNNAQTNRQQINRQQINRQQTNKLQQQLSKRQRQTNKRLLQNQPAPRVNQTRPQRPKVKPQRVNISQAQRVTTQKVNPKLLTVSISNPSAMESHKPVKINRNKPKMQMSGSTLNDRFGQLQQQPGNVPNANKQRRQKQQGRGQTGGGRTVLLV